TVYPQSHHCQRRPQLVAVAHSPSYARCHRCTQARPAPPLRLHKHQIQPTFTTTYSPTILLPYCIQLGQFRCIQSCVTLFLSHTHPLHSTNTIVSPLPSRHSLVFQGPPKPTTVAHCERASNTLAFDFACLRHSYSTPLVTHPRLSPLDFR